jgi:UDP-N-acetylmuramoylalanine--D-glutamate ligase
MGLDNEKLKREFADIVPTICDCNTFEDAMQAAHKLATPGDTVLLSPACASFDLFKNYEDRGRQFKTWVANNILKNNE